MSEFETLEQIFSMMTPADLLGRAKLNLGGSLDESSAPLKAISDILENDGKGVLSTQNIIERLNTLVKKTDTSTIKEELKFLFTCYSTHGQLDFASDDATAYMSKDGPQKISNVKEIIGKGFDLKGTDILLMSSRSPFFHPSKRHTKKIELFLNSMPSTVMSQLTPILDIEFQIQKYPVDGLPFLNQLRFLMGDASEPTDGPNKAILAGQRLLKIDDAKDQREMDFSGMEMFTSPQTLVNPTPNISATGRQQYSEILDPFRPFASIESFTITSRSSVGMMSFKTAQLTIKLHDRSRLAEISDLIRPQSYGNVTLWATYGWRAPERIGNPYFEFINNNMLMREAYCVSNSSFSFDQVGQVTLNLELFTKGSEVSLIPITQALDTKGGDTAISLMRKIKGLANDIAKYRKILKLDPPEGINKEVRAYQILDAAETGEFPNFKATEIEASIKQLSSSLSHSKGVDKDSANKLIEAMKSLYEKDKDSKFNLKERISTLSTKEVANKFKEVVTGPDPYLIDDSKKETKDSPLYNEIQKFESAPKGKVETYTKKVVSFGKLFSTFGLSCILGADAVEEIQVFFYGLNEQCGPISGHSIAEFPIDMASFIDQYTDYVTRKGGENITLDEFFGLIINAQVLDFRAIGYGLRSFYDAYDPKNKAAKIKKDQEQKFESALMAMGNKYGPFKKPVIEMYIETTHEKASELGNSDILTRLSYSAKDFTPTTRAAAKAMNSRRIMRIHIYDKQLNPYREAATLLKSFDGSGFIELPSTDYAKKFIKDVTLSVLQGSLIKVLEGVYQDAVTGKIKLTEFTNARQVKDLVSKLVPTITYGSNGTSVFNASLTTKSDPLANAVNMMRANTAKNTTGPNGSGEGGIPLRVIPAQLSMQTFGCPLATMAQFYFIDFNTGTSIDNLYICTGVNHTMTPGKFETTWTFGFQDAYGVFEGAPNIFKQLSSLTSF